MSGHVRSHVRNLSHGLAVVLMLFLAGCAGPAAQRDVPAADRISRVVVFGDSPSDGGAAHALIGARMRQLYP